MSMMPRPVIRTMQPGEVAFAVACAREEGWNPGLHDAATMAAVDEEGFFAAEVAGRLVGCISAVRHDDHHGFLGYYIVQRDLRGQGIGLLLWQRGLEHLGDRLVALDGVVDQQAHYLRSGFRLAHRNLRFVGPASAWGVTPATPVALGGVASVTHQALVDLDTASAPGPRPRYLSAWLHQPQAQSVIALEKDLPVGLAVRRPCHTGVKVGPVLAARTDVAEAMISHLVAGLGQTPVTLDVPEPNAAAVTMAGAHDMQVVFETARMYRGTPPPMDLDRLFGVMSFELG